MVNNSVRSKPLLDTHFCYVFLGNIIVSMLPVLSGHACLFVKPIEASMGTGLGCEPLKGRKAFLESWALHGPDVQHGIEAIGCHPLVLPLGPK